MSGDDDLMGLLKAVFLGDDCETREDFRDHLEGRGIDLDAAEGRMREHIRKLEADRQLVAKGLTEPLRRTRRKWERGER